MITITVPGSKSITNRALLIAALAKGKSILRNVLKSDDTERMMNALRMLGVKIKKSGSEIVIHGGNLRKPRGKLFCGNSGTTLRFLTALLATQNFECVLTGDARMRERPIGDLVDALIQLGAEIKYLRKKLFPPIKISSPINRNVCEISGKLSSQFLSGLLMAAPLADYTITVYRRGDLVSKPYIDLTLKIMKTFGVRVEKIGYKKFIIRAGQKYRARDFKIEGDASSASYFWGISALTGEKINVKNIPLNSAQADLQFLKILKKYPCFRKPLCTNGCKPASLDINCRDFPDSAMALAILCAFTKGKFRLSGLSNLRVKECDRLHALATELKRIGCRAQELHDGLKIYGNPEKLHGATIETYNDHRMAMCFGMAGFVLPGIKIKNSECVKKTYPDFWKDLSALKKKFLRKNIILTGMRGSGKTRLGKMLAAKLKRKFVDIDALIEKTAKKTVSEIVAKKGWKYFRKLERTATKKAARMKNVVIATGGGTLMYPENIKALKKNSRIIFLYAKTDVLKKRLKNKQNRPPLTARKNFLNELREIHKKRLFRYKKVSDIVFDVSQQTKNRNKDLDIKLKKLLNIIS